MTRNQYVETDRLTDSYFPKTWGEEDIRKFATVMLDLTGVMLVKDINPESKYDYRVFEYVDQ